MKFALRVVLFFVAWLNVSAIEPSKRKLIDQVIEVMNMPASIEAQRVKHIELMRLTLTQQAGEKAGDAYVVRLRNRAMEKYANYTRELFDWYVWEKRFVAYYDVSFTEAQLKELLAFLKTGTGQALLRSQNDLATQVQQWVLENDKEAERRIQRIIQETLAEVSAEVQAATKDLHQASPVELEKHAVSGDPVAQYLLGRAYADGKGVGKSIDDAIKWYRLAAEQGDTPSLDMLGALYFSGDGVAKDIRQARQFFQRSAELGSAIGAYSIGYMFFHGHGVEKDSKEAFRWFLQSANGGHGASQYQVALQYWNGEGVEKNLTEAYAWIKVAQENSVEGADESQKFMSPRLNSDQIADGGMRFVELKRAIKAKLQGLAK